MIVRMGKPSQKKQRPLGISPWRPLSRQHAADGLNSFIPHQRRNLGRYRGFESQWSLRTGKPYQNRIKTGSIFEDLLLSGKKQKVRRRIRTVSKPHLLRLLSLLIERKADSPTC